MRVIAGKYGRRRLAGPGKIPLRPTGDRLRETLFNILGAAVEHSYFVDAYAGTGAIGIEAISRGAERVFFLEKHPATARLIRNNIETLGIGDVTEILDGDVEQGLERLAARHIFADFIFVDPPYDQAAEYVKTLEFLDASHLLAPTGTIIVEHFHKLELPGRLEKLECVRIKEQGDATLSFYRIVAAA
jgi:16S rRNA (guanine966-N2)-methyltransferase